MVTSRAPEGTGKVFALQDRIVVGALPGPCVCSSGYWSIAFAHPCVRDQLLMSLMATMIAMTTMRTTRMISR